MCCVFPFSFILGFHIGFTLGFHIGSTLGFHIGFTLGFRLVVLGELWVSHPVSLYVVTYKVGEAVQQGYFSMSAETSLLVSCVCISVFLSSSGW